MLIAGPAVLQGVVEELSTKRLLTTERVPGVAVDQVRPGVWRPSSAVQFGRRARTSLMLADLVHSHCMVLNL